MPTRRNLAREHSDLQWTIDELQAAILKEIRVLENGLHVTDYILTTTNPPAIASFYTAIRGGRTTTSNGKKNYHVFTVRVSTLPMHVLQ